MPGSLKTELTLHMSADVIRAFVRCGMVARENLPGEVVRHLDESEKVVDAQTILKRDAC